MKTLLKTLFGAACLAAVSGAAGAHAAPAARLVDCPLRDAPFSLQTPLIDIMLSPAARAVIDRRSPGITAKLPARFAGTTPPTFAAILSLREAGGMMRLPAADLTAIVADLAKLPVTRADKIARCARYDTVVPRFTVPAGRPRVLLFEKINGFRDGPSVDAAHAAFVAMAQRKGWALVTTDKGAAFNPAVLRQFDTVIWNNISGDVLTLSQRAAFQAWMQRGGGFIGVHGSAGDPVYFWDWYADSLIGARFQGHPMNPQFQTAQVRLEDTAHPVAAGLPTKWDANDEWYSFKTNPRATGARIIATLDEKTYKPDGMGGIDLRMGDHPIAWSRCIGSGRMFYSAIGHRPERYADANYVQMLEQAVAWTSAPKTGRRADDCRPAR